MTDRKYNNRRANVIVSAYFLLCVGVRAGTCETHDDRETDPMTRWKRKKITLTARSLKRGLN